MDPVNSLDSLNSLNTRESSKYSEITGDSESTYFSESSEFVQMPWDLGNDWKGAKGRATRSPSSISKLCETARGQWFQLHRSFRAYGDPEP